MDNGEERTPELTTLQQKVEYMVEKTFPGEKISGRVFADLVKERGGSLSHSYFSNILAGKVTNPSEEILKALGLGFGVDWRFFKDESEVVDDVVAGLQFLAKRRAGEISGLAGLGVDDDGLGPELLQFVLSLLEDNKDDKDDKGGKDGRDNHPEGTPGGQPG
jgi:transcriptional regulator with XRE-family HTH domain